MHSPTIWNVVETLYYGHNSRATLYVLLSLRSRVCAWNFHTYACMLCVPWLKFFETKDWGFGGLSPCDSNSLILCLPLLPCTLSQRTGHCVSLFMSFDAFTCPQLNESLWQLVVMDIHRREGRPQAVVVYVCRYGNQACIYAYLSCSSGIWIFELVSF